jgi:hypothetical protein
VADLLRRKLTVPEIYLKPRVPGVTGVDVLAVDHAGSGDIHGVEILFDPHPAKSVEVGTWIVRAKELPFHFKYIAVPAGALADPASFQYFAGSRAVDINGIGRLGLIEFSDDLLYELRTDDSEVDESRAAVNSAILRIKPERFLLRGENLAKMEKFLQKNKPDISVRI